MELKLTLDRGSLTILIARELERVRAEQRKLEVDKAEYGAMREKVASIHFSSTIKLGEWACQCVNPLTIKPQAAWLFVLAPLVRADIGGTVFKTAVDTLRRVEGSLLAQMFSGSGVRV